MLSQVVVLGVTGKCGEILETLVRAKPSIRSWSDAAVDWTVSWKVLRMWSSEEVLLQ